MLVGYVRVSTADDRQSTDLQRDALLSAGVDERNMFEDRSSGSRDDRPGLKACLEYVRPGDVLAVWKLDRLGRSLPHLIQIVTGLREARGWVQVIDRGHRHDNGDGRIPVPRLRGTGSV